MKIHILAEVKNGPWGGTSQFLKALRRQWEISGIYENSPEKAEVILFNSYPTGTEYLFDKLYKLKKRYPEKIVLYRIDGPISGYRGTGIGIDRAIALCCDIFADGIVFQSEWSRKKNKEKFNIKTKYESVILNAPDNTLFNNNDKEVFSPFRKTRLISSSWSTNPNKGFDILEWLDEHLDFSKYDFMFVGNSPIKFKNIKMHPPVASPELATLLKKHDIYIFTSKIEACSNALIEALACGLPTVALNATSNPEVVRQGGELFTGTENILDKLNLVTKSYSRYLAFLPQFKIESVAYDYLSIAKSIYNASQNKIYQPKVITLERKKLFFLLKTLVWQNKIKNILKTVLKFLLRPFYEK
ncbi:MAG TPA: glycosyltransferase family 4 protein [Patescibacteria group bacterium]|nr:glycosyltransferase family 4 protein [Patescibacteria group bacterium]